MEALKSWKEEKQSAYMYRALANIDTNSVHKKLFLELSTLAEKQAAIWGKQLEAENHEIPSHYHPGLRVHLILGLVRCFGPRAMKVALAAMKVRGMSVYRGIEMGHPQPTPEQMEQQHAGIGNGNNLRAAVFGVNDGLISNASLILGVAGAHVAPSMILLSGIAGLLAGACSMGAGEYVSVRSQREMLEYQLHLEKEELALYPEEEAAELALIYEARGLPKEDARKMAHLLIQNPEKALDTLAREELGINPSELVSPWGAAISSFLSFAVGAFIPLIPFLFRDLEYNLSLMLGLTGISLFTVGAILSLFTHRSAILGGLRMLGIGALAGALTYFIGSIFR